MPHQLAVGHDSSNGQASLSGVTLLWLVTTQKWAFAVAWLQVLKMELIYALAKVDVAHKKSSKIV